MNKMIDLADRKRNAVCEVLEAGQDYRKNYILNNIVPERNARKHNNRTCHIHDLEYYDITYNCLGVSVSDLVGNRSRSFRGKLCAL